MLSIFFGDSFIAFATGVCPSHIATAVVPSSYLSLVSKFSISYADSISPPYHVLFLNVESIGENRLSVNGLTTPMLSSPVLNICFISSIVPYSDLLRNHLNPYSNGSASTAFSLGFGIFIYFPSPIGMKKLLSFSLVGSA